MISFVLPYVSQRGITPKKAVHMDGFFSFKQKVATNIFLVKIKVIMNGKVIEYSLNHPVD